MPRATVGLALALAVVLVPTQALARTHLARSAPHSSEAPPLRARTVRVAVIVGNNRGHDVSRSLRFAEQDARKVHRVLTELGDVPPTNAFLLTGRQGAEVWSTLQRAERLIRREEQVPDTRTLLVVYYSGHADGEVLELGRSELSFVQLVRFLRASQADIRLAFVDSCRSGRLLAAKGGRRGPGYRIQVADAVASSGYAVVTSSADDELSQESSEIRGSFFTHFLVSALRGAGDMSHDGQITLGEAYRYTYLQTVARTSTTVGGSQHPMYDFKLAGRGDIVITSTRRRGAALVVEAGTSGAARVVVTDGDARAMVAEGLTEPGRPARLALEPGRYVVYLMAGAGVRRAEVHLARGEERVLQRRSFTHQPLSRTVSKGGLFHRRWDHTISGGLLLRRMPLESGSLALGAALQYGLEFSPGWQTVARLAWSTAADAGLSTGYNELGVHAGLFHRWRALPSPLGLGLLLGYEQLLQDDRAGLSRRSSAFSYLSAVSLELPVGLGFALHLDGGVGGRLFRLREEGTVHRLDLQLTVGLGWSRGGS